MRRDTFLLLAPLLSALPDALTAVDAGLRGYLEAHCFDCHGSTKKKGGLDLERLPLRFDTSEALNAEQEISSPDLPAIRLFSVAQHPTLTPPADVKGPWDVCSQQSLPQFSAAAATCTTL